MFCSKCGTQVVEGAAFCYNCGSPIAGNIPPAAAPTPAAAPVPQAAPTPAAAPTASYSGEIKKAGVTLVFPDGHNEIGDAYISNTEIKFIKKSKAVRLTVGFLGNHLENGEERLRLMVSDIACGGRTRIGLNAFVYQITMNNGDIYKFCVNLPKTLAYFEAVVEHK